MLHFPTVMVGGPVRDREWAVPMWLGGLSCQDYRGDVRLAVLVNDSVDGTLDACRWWADNGRWSRAQVNVLNWGCPTDNNVRRDRDYLQFARARDAWTCMRDDDVEWLLQVDSDVQLPADTLSRLIELATDHDVKVLAACIQNAWGAPNFAGNVMICPSGYPEPMHWPGFLSDRSPGVKPCDLTGAAVLIHRDVYDAGITYVLPDVGLETEDGPFCQACIAAGYQPHYAPSIWATHWMQAPVSTAYLSDTRYHQQMADWHAHRAKELDHAAG